MLGYDFRWVRAATDSTRWLVGHKRLALDLGSYSEAIANAISDAIFIEYMLYSHKRPIARQIDLALVEVLHKMQHDFQQASAISSSSVGRPSHEPCVVSQALHGERSVRGLHLQKYVCKLRKQVGGELHHGIFEVVAGLDQVQHWARSAHQSAVGRAVRGGAAGGSLAVTASPAQRSRPVKASRLQATHRVARVRCGLAPACCETRT